MSEPDEVIAFYLPQFHPIPENDQFWGRGFTEWTNVAAARPLTRGHRQPFLPADLGFYDLRLPEVRVAQAQLAKSFGVSAFCYWHYWFAGHQVLETPLREVVRTGEPDFPFCVGWANESWTGVWHGAPHHLLIEQTYPGADDHRRHFDSLLETFSDPRYVRVDGRPLFYIYEPWAIPEINSVLDLWRGLAERAGLGGLYLVSPCGDTGTWHPQEHGLDGSLAIRLPERKQSSLWRRGPTVVRYADVLDRLTSLAWDDNFPCVIPRWDNTPRAGRDGLMLGGSTPELFRYQVQLAVAKLASLPEGQRLLFVKSWNEWAEGNVLEPDKIFGYGYLEALRDGISHPAVSVPSKAAYSWTGSKPRGIEDAISHMARRIAAGEGPRSRLKKHDAPVPVIMSIDCEPDPRMVDPANPAELTGYVMANEYFARWRERAAIVTGEPAHFNWFFRMDAQIEQCYGSAAAFPERYPQFVDNMLAAGDGIGLHPHAWRWDLDRGTWFGDFAGWTWPLENLELGLESFRHVFGHAPEMLRFGDATLSNEVVARAEAAGISYDLTLEPGRPAQPLPEDPYVRPLVGEWANELQPDWTKVPRVPYFPDPLDYRRPLRSGERGIRMIPLSSGAPWLGRSLKKRFELIRTNGYRYRNQTELLYMALPGWSRDNSFNQVLKRSLVAQERPYFAFAVRTDRALQPERWRRIDRCLYDLLGLQQQRRLVFCTPSEALELLGLRPASSLSSSVKTGPSS